MFETALDQAAGLRTLFPVQRTSVLALGCTAGAPGRQAGVDAIVQALARAGYRPLLIDLSGESSGQRHRSAGGIIVSPAGASGDVARIDADALLPEGCGGDELAGFIGSLSGRVPGRRSSFDLAVVAADPLRLADLAAGALERIVLLARARADELALLYSQVKAIHLAHGFRAYCTVFPDTASRRVALSMHRRLADAAGRFLGVPIDFGGALDTLDDGWFGGYVQPLLPPVPAPAH